MKTANGFTAVELLVTMIIGTLSIIAAYQLYSFVLTDSAETRNLAAASNLAYRFLREGSSAVQTPCVGSSTSYTSSIPSSAQLPPAPPLMLLLPASEAVALRCRMSLPL